MPTSQERDAIEKRLQEERDEALEDLRRFDEQRGTLQDESGEMSVYRFHMADIGTESMEREKQFLLASKEGERLYEIDEALRRLYRDPEGFGTCASCEAEIQPVRLMMLPSTRYCSDCARKVED